MTRDEPSHITEADPVHPSDADWKRYQRSRCGQAEWQALTAHLQTCPECLATVRCQTAVGCILGRPVPALFPINVENLIASAWLPLIRTRLGSCAPIRIAAADWRSEPLLYRLLALSTSRLRREGRSVSVVGALFNDLDANPKTSADVAIILNAPSVENLSDPKGLTIEVASAGEWSCLNGAVDFIVSAPGDTYAETRWDELRSEIVEALSNGPNVAREAIILNAGGVDVPSAFFAGIDPPLLFAQVETERGVTLPWWSVPSPLLAAEVVREWCAKRSETVRTMVAGLHNKIPSGSPLHRRLTRTAFLRNIDF
ncbi:MAG TPA: hypothetical protein VKU01_23240 [Bryobacteraceae bacterium]|nr:hypothetical protein [Bryobacteraceae bacterium]